MEQKKKTVKASPKAKGVGRQKPAIKPKAPNKTLMMGVMAPPLPQQNKLRSNSLGEEMPPVRRQSLPGNVDGFRSTVSSVGPLPDAKPETFSDTDISKASSGVGTGVEDIPDAVKGNEKGEDAALGATQLMAPAAQPADVGPALSDIDIDLPADDTGEFEQKTVKVDRLGKDSPLGAVRTMLMSAIRPPPQMPAVGSSGLMTQRRFPLRIAIVIVAVVVVGLACAMVGIFVLGDGEASDSAPGTGRTLATSATGAPDGKATPPAAAPGAQDAKSPAPGKAGENASPPTADKKVAGTPETSSPEKPDPTKNESAAEPPAKAPKATGGKMVTITLTGVPRNASLFVNGEPATVPITVPRSLKKSVKIEAITPSQRYALKRVVPTKDKTVLMRLKADKDGKGAHLRKGR